MCLNINILFFVLFNRFANCGVNKYNMTDYRRGLLSGCEEHLPVIYDFAGMDNENTPALKEILSLVMRGMYPNKEYIYI